MLTRIAAIGFGVAVALLPVLVAQETKPPTVSLKATAQTLDGPGNVRFTWSATNASNVFFTAKGLVASEGNLDMLVKETTTHALLAEGPGGLASTRVTVVVTGSRDSPTFEARPPHAVRREAKVAAKDLLTALDRIKGLLQAEGFRVFDPATQARTITLITAYKANDELLKGAPSNVVERRVSYEVRLTMDSVAGAVRVAVAPSVQFKRQVERTYFPEDPDGLITDRAAEMLLNKILSLKW